MNKTKKSDSQIYIENKLVVTNGEREGWRGNTGVRGKDYYGLY